MKIKLIQMTQNPIDVMWVAARTCYSAKSPIEMWEIDRFPMNEGLGEWEYEYNRDSKHWNLVKQVLDSGHSSIAEHVYFTFAIEGISRSCSHQLVRHRLAVFSQKSQRYVEIKEDYNKLGNDGTSINEDNYLERADLIEILDKYFIWNHDNYAEFHALIQALYCYLYQVQEMNMKPEDARQILPNATKTDIVMSMNLGELIHVCNLRLCHRASLEIRKLFQAIKKEVETQDERLASLLVPSCEVYNMCFEDKCCGKRPKVNEVIKNYKT